MKLDEISKELQESALSPGRLSELHISLAGEYAFISSRLSEVLKVEDKLWNAIREHTDTDAKANRIWGELPEIIDMKVYKNELKSIEKMMASIRLRISVMENESKNLF